MNKKQYAGQFIVVVLFVLATLASITLGGYLINSSNKVKTYKRDFFKANQLRHGFLNGHKWSVQVEDIIEQKIDSFTLSSKNKEVLREQVSGVMYRLLDQVEAMLHEKKKKFSANIKRNVLRMLVDMDDLRGQVPKFASIVVEETEKSGNRAKVKSLLKTKISELLANRKTKAIDEQDIVLDKYKQKDLVSFNKLIAKRTKDIEVKQRTWGYQLIAIMGLILIFWWILIKANFRKVFAVAFLLTVLISFVNLYIGIKLPMLEIDARISELNLEILQSHIVFYDQVLFYQSKSILDVAMIMLTKGKTDAIFVGILILIFSVFFPAVKLLAASVYLFSKKKSNQFIQVMAFKSGKWSMADVMVVAIFIAYIGFQSIITEQLNHVSTKANVNEQVNVLTTNRSNLQIGFLVFVCFALFNLILAVILKRITRDDPNKVTKFRDAFQTFRGKRLERKAARGHS